ncbi:SDR family oxidoreductase [Lichenihabitans sp. Uapishka_5]|uniref:SDR family oxidoreductase n=1 Tax=Lichenihabitans sp. Uapishka_5 TaxID=3037302 RepID=UPI0029E82332|nr:SDR family oxidoreductase [Lichenihabitans sp. Uapishka_5]MDX7952828.1 SDR family oxidoreductase [Lichenihabitans sp. Uapishka_5]
MTDKTTLSPVLVLGATSDIGMAVAHRCAESGADLILAARASERLEGDAQDLRLRHRIAVDVVEFDILADVPGAWIDRLPRLPEAVVCVVGLLGDQAASTRDGAAAERVMTTNYVAPALLLGEFANRMEARGSGVIVGVSSVAGDRGRASNYVYGGAKAGFTAFLSGLRARLSRTPVRVVTLKPGFVATKMTAGMTLPPLLTAQPREVAEATWKALQGGRDVIYVRPVWRLIMSIIAMVPEPIFKKMRF